MKIIILGGPRHFSLMVNDENDGRIMKIFIGADHRGVNFKKKDHADIKNAGV